MAHWWPTKKVHFFNISLSYTFTKNSTFIKICTWSAYNCTIRVSIQVIDLNLKAFRKRNIVTIHASNKLCIGIFKAMI